jgi:hypothetical protein
MSLPAFSVAMRKTSLITPEKTYAKNVLLNWPIPLSKHNKSRIHKDKKDVLIGHPFKMLL